MSSTVKNINDMRWVIGGTVFLLTVGMALVTIASIHSKEAATTMAALGGMITMGVAGILGLSKVNELSRASEGIEAKLDTNTHMTGVAAAETKQIGRALNGDLDRRIAEAVQKGLREWTPPSSG